MAGADDFEVAEATYRAAVARWPMARIMLRQGAQAVHEGNDWPIEAPVIRAPGTIPAARKRMRERLMMISVSFDPKRGYITTGADVLPFTALSLSGLRRQLEDAHRGEEVEIKLVLDRTARLERDQRRRGGAFRDGDYSRPR
jgi:hypothetical protein